MPPAAGGTFPDHVLPGLGGAPLRLADAWSGGRALVVVAHADCGTSRLALPFVDRLHRRRGPGAGVVAVLQEDDAGARRLCGELGLALPVALDLDPYALSRQLTLEAVPTLFELGPGGRILAVHEGFRRDGFEALAAALGVAAPFFAAGDDAPPLRPG
jgi:hypothetical protein